MAESKVTSVKRFPIPTEHLFPRKTGTATSDKSYRMNLPRLGVSIIINNMASAEVESEADVTALRVAYETVGFDIYVYRDCDGQEMKRIMGWIMQDETHVYCNAFSIIILHRGGEDGAITDSNGDTALTVEELVAELCGVNSLKNKPKIVITQRYIEDNESDSVEISSLSSKPDVFILYSHVTGYSSPEKGIGSEYMQTYAKYLKEEYMNKPIHEIFDLVNQVINQKTMLTDAVLMEMAQHVAGRDVESLALEVFGIEAPTVTNFKELRQGDIKKFSFDMFRIWRNKAVGNTKETLAELMLENTSKYGCMDPKDIIRILQPVSGENAGDAKKSSHEINGLTRQLHISDFHMVERRKIKLLEEKIKQFEEDRESGESLAGYDRSIEILISKFEERKALELKKTQELTDKIEQVTAEKEEIEKRIKAEREETREKMDKSAALYENNIEMLNHKIEELKASEQEKIQKLTKKIEEVSTEKEDIGKQIEAEREETKEKMRKLEAELEENVKKMKGEREEERKRLEDRERQKTREWEEKVAQLSEEKTNYELEIQRMNDDKERERARLREEGETIRTIAKDKASRLTDENIYDVSSRLLKREDISRLGVKLGIEPHLIDKHFTNNPEAINVAAHNVLRTWLYRQEDSQQAYENLRKALIGSGLK